MKITTLIYFLLAFLLASFIVRGQNKKIPDGIYNNFDQLQRRSPAYNTDLIIIKIENRNTDSENEYDLRSGIDSINKNYIKNNIYAYVNDGSVYLNCYNLGLCKGFAVSETFGRYLTFYAAKPCKKVKENAIARDAIVGASLAFGAIIVPGGGADIRIEKPVYSLDMDSGKIYVLNKVFLKGHLTPYPDLKEKYKNEKLPYRDEVMIRYVEMLNSRIKEENE